MLEVDARSFIYPCMQERVQRKLALMQHIRTGKSVDVYFDTVDFALLRHSQMVFLRRREDFLLQIKFGDLTSPQACIEREFILDAEHVPEEAHTLLRTFHPPWRSASTWQETREVNQLEEVMLIDKQRSVYADETCLVYLDTVTNLGQFVEIEIHCSEKTDMRSAKKQVEAFLAEIGGTPLKASYFEMLLYRQGHPAYSLIPARFHEERLHPGHP